METLFASVNDQTLYAVYFHENSSVVDWLNQNGTTGTHNNAHCVTIVDCCGNNLGNYLGWSDGLFPIADFVTSADYDVFMARAIRLRMPEAAA